MKWWIEKHMKLCCLSLKPQSSGLTHTTLRCEIHTSSVLLSVLLIYILFNHVLNNVVAW